MVPPALRSGNEEGASVTVPGPRPHWHDAVTVAVEVELQAGRGSLQPLDDPLEQLGRGELIRT